ncbi:hypothetical protein [Elizabethkingia miricola]|uniref:hypothetical protein n=1 Tax=Elizabethkingia miricola TaxID=172045 RepID=UPI0013755088|nr:hypothetical protein [Elizabethkingia miricola]NHQ65094.1 hypothetical protein [Elizabethkingia miricola]NHQ72255.1 hypothetical protein [Elizabethkingia miricola]NHQ76638.1 hypothetical protein [Elizabethkingia miricola]UIO95310.1 hypothetical protein LYZ41_14015 [Elizabethkingia miricola]WER12106.1 hypothetical protein P0M31_13795 [Elizabethkingia miricola]
MLQLILMLLGLAFPNNNRPAPVNHPTTISAYGADGDQTDPGSDTGGDEGQTPPPKK